MVLPIEASMASRAHFDAVLSLTMGGITLLYIGFGLVRAHQTGEQRAEGNVPLMVLPEALPLCGINVSMLLCNRLQALEPHGLMHVANVPRLHEMHMDT